MPKQAHKWYNGRPPAALLGILALALAYGVGSKALDTGSWQQYFLTFALVIFALNRLVRAVVPKKKAANA